MSEAQSPRTPEITVIVPTLNERASIDILLEGLLTLPELAGRLEVIVADDASDDGTGERVEAWAEHHPVRLLRRMGPPDLSASVLEAANWARGRWVVVMDADGSHPVKTVPRLIEVLQQDRADIAIGSRHVPGGGASHWPWYRRLASRLASMLAWPFTEVRDPMSGLFATCRHRLASLAPEQAGYKILLEVLVRTCPEPRVEEVPYVFVDRDRGESKMTLAVQWLFVKRLAALGGARLSLATAGRFGAVGLSGVAVDLLVFQIMLLAGVGLAGAHMGSFLVATLSNFALNYFWTFRRIFASDEPVINRYLRFFAVACLSMLLRGGVLAMLVSGLGVSAAIAIVPAILVTAAVNYLGALFYVFPTPEAKKRNRVRLHLAAIGLIAYVFTLRLVYLGQVDLLVDEMYYWTYNLYPALSYLDHPPLTAWTIAVGSWLAGDTPFGVRLPLLVLAPLTGWYAYQYGKAMYDKTSGLLTALLAFVLPGLFASGFLITTDALLVTAWMAALVYFHRALVEQQGRAFFGLAVAMGLGLLAKYTMVLVAFAALVFIWMHPPARQWLRRPQPYLAAALATALFSPVLIWNWQHDWASFAFQSTRRIVENPAFGTPMILVWTLLAMAPLGGFVAFYLLGPIRRMLAPVEVNRRFMLIMALVPLGLFAVYGTLTEVKFHWVIPAWLAMLPMIASTMRTQPGLDDRAVLTAFRRLWPPAMLVALIAFGLLLHYLTLGLPGIGWREHRLGYLGWPEIAEQVHRLEQEVEAATGQRPIIVGMNKWSTAAALTFHDVDRRRDNITSRNLVGMGGSQWERWFDPQTDPNRPLILVNHEPKLIQEDWLEGAVIGLGPLQSLPVYRDGVVVQRLYYRMAEGFRPAQLRYPGHRPD